MVQGKLVAGQSGRPEAVEMKKLKTGNSILNTQAEERKRAYYTPTLYSI
jgi:hypothetical protein